MPFYKISMSVYIDLFSAAGLEIKIDFWVCVTLKPQTERIEIYEADVRLLRSHHPSPT